MSACSVCMLQGTACSCRPRAGCIFCVSEGHNTVFSSAQNILGALMHAPNGGTSGRSMSSWRAGSTSFLSLTIKSWPSSVCATSSCHSCIAARQVAVCKKAQHSIPFSKLQDDSRLCIQSDACLAILLHCILKSLTCVPAPPAWASSHSEYHTTTSRSIEFEQVRLD